MSDEQTQEPEKTGDAAGAGSPQQAEDRGATAGRKGKAQGPTLQSQDAAPPPPPRKKKRRDGALSAASGVLSFLMLLLFGGVFGFIAVQRKMAAPGPLASDVTVYFPPRTDLLEMLSMLESKGVIESPALINLVLLIERSREKVRPGEYAFKPHVSAREAIDEMIAGRQVLHAVTIPEGLTSEQIVQRLRENDILVGDLTDAPKEGVLLPETYKVARGFPRSKLISKMQDDQRKLVEQIWAKRAHDLPLRTPFELVTLASIVEKETGKTEERPRVAAVFVNRLRKGMRLQSDPTIVYGLVGGKGSLGRGILRSEIDKWTEYNTYAIDGLPKGPIANPGRAALEATANPAHTNDLFFVADGTGGHVFADSLDQHSRNVQRWRQIERDQKDQKDLDRPAPGAAPAPTPARDKRTDAGFGRLADATAADYPVGAAMAADAGPTHRLGRVPPYEAAFTLGGYEDAARAAHKAYAALRPARPFFSEESSRLPDPAAADGALYALSDPVAAAEDPAAAQNETAMAPEGADGRAIAVDDVSSVGSYPVSAKLRAEQKARAVRLGLDPGADRVPGEVIGARAPDATPAGATAQVAAATEPAARPRPRAFDASEGTALDPLRDKSWDLTTAKVVPAGASFR